MSKDQEKPIKKSVKRSHVMSEAYMEYLLSDEFVENEKRSITEEEIALNHQEREIDQAYYDEANRQYNSMFDG